MTRHEASRRFPNASEAFLKANCDSIAGETPGSFMERAAGDEPLEAHQAQARHPGIVLVRVTSFRRRLLDEDNLAEKYHVDCCRYAGLIAGDSPDQTRIQVAQVKVATKEEERTLIEIEQL